ncbi:uncharacterized protein N7484_002914 [Penicillium longicatenatum]|uniref:uncharacterized protein n=1 Tax=Penicillium longicatenatum TaxID=1561947 RepID=UPI002548740A|nr:uncharacterized protein N7484_002914 [Penicillium longicatenatum]KAJ5649191.1 hypothetical protein N7484_002914 [Penicillium longicatenatum]
MAKGKKKSVAKGKKKNAQKSAHPISDRANTSDDASGSESPKGESSADAEHRAQQKQRQNKRSPTHKDDFAPGELSDGYQSNDETDPDLENASEQDAPMEHQPDPVGRWVKNIIKSETDKAYNMMGDFFTSSEPQYDQCEAFFERLNQQIRAANDKHDVNDIDIGTMPQRGYVDLCRTWGEEHLKAKERGSPEDAWNAFHNTQYLLKHFNRRHNLPKTWNISSVWAEREIGTPDPKVDMDTDETSIVSNEPGHSGQVGADNRSDISSDLDDNENQPTGLDALEARAMKEQRRLSSAKVLHWWPKGTDSQTFVRYGDRGTPIFRIRAGSYKSYNPSRVERILTSKTRGTAKVTGKRNDLPDEWWKYERKHVDDFVGVGWKVEEDDESSTDALSLIKPEKGALYPQTRTLAKWKDGVFTLEGRAFIRRITKGPALEGDRVLYQKAHEMESAYRAKHGLDEAENDTSDDGSVEGSCYIIIPLKLSSDGRLLKQ